MSRQAAIGGAGGAAILSETGTVVAAIGAGVIVAETGQPPPGVGAADGVASVAGVGTLGGQSIGSADGAASISGVGVVGHTSVGTANGAASVSGVAGSNRAIGTANGQASVLGIPSSIARAVGTADGGTGDIGFAVTGAGTSYAYVTINESDCIEPGKGQPVLKFSRVDPAQLPREVELQFVDVAQNYATITQSARHSKALIKGGVPERHASTTATAKSSVAIDFFITGAEGRTLAFDLLYRAWTESVSMDFIHPDLRFEAGDTFKMVGRFGSLIGRIDEQTWTKQRTNSIQATLLAPVSPAMSPDDTLPGPANAVQMRANIGIGIWGAVGAWGGQTTPGDISAECCAPAQAQALGTPGIVAHIRLKKKATASTPAVEFAAGAG